MKNNEELMTADFDVEEFIEEEYANPDEPPAEETPAEETPAEKVEEEKAEETPAEEVENPVLPPGFKAEEAKPEEKPAGEDIDLAEIDATIEAETNENKKSNMARMRTKIQAQADRLAELEAKKDEQPADASEYEKKLEEAHNRIAQLDLTEDPRFRAKYDNRITSALGDITELVKENFDSEDEAKSVVSQMANMNPVQRNKFMIDNDVPEHYRMELVSRFRDADSIWRERQEAVQNFQETKKSLQLESTVDDQKQTAEIREAVFQKATATLQASEDLLSPQPDNPVFNDFVTKRQQAARTIVESNDPELQTRMMIQGSLMPTYKAMFELTQKQLVEAQAELAKHTGGKPDFNGGTPPGGKPEDKKLPDNNDALADYIVNS